MELPEVSGIEPDYCFYIDNWSAIAGKDRVDWEVDPAPDLVIEVDVTSYTNVDDYLPYKVPEVWLFKQQLLIYQLQEDSYVLQSNSQYFPDFDLSKIVLEYLQISRQRNTSTANRELRRKLTNED